jgi:DNA primase
MPRPLKFQSNFGEMLMSTTDLEWKAKADRFVEELKDKADIADVIESLSPMRFQQKRVGRFRYAQHPNSFAVDEDWGQFTWFAQAGSGGHPFETGDVLTWMQRYANMDFWQACLWLAERYGVEVPKGMKGDSAQAKEIKSRGQMFEIAARWFEAQLWNTPAALDYARGRGWSEETIRKARLGYSGGTFEAVKDLAGTFSMNEVNSDDPAAVSLIGRRGDVAAWMKAQGITDASESWLENNSIVGLATFPRLVYPHIWRGRVNYFSGRNLQWEDGKLAGQDAPKDGKPKGHNLPRALIGERARFFNAEFHRGAEICFVVEGQADAITLAQWGFPAVALVGVAADEGLAAILKQMKIKAVYVALDEDAAGQAALMKVAGMFGAMTRLFGWNIPGRTSQPNLVIEENNE